MTESEFAVVERLKEQLAAAESDAPAIRALFVEYMSEKEVAALPTTLERLKSLVLQYVETIQIMEDGTRQCLRLRSMVYDLWEGGEALWRRLDLAERETRTRALERAVVAKLPHCVACINAGKSRLATHRNPQWTDVSSFGWCDFHAGELEAEAKQRGRRAHCVGDPYPWAQEVRDLEKSCGVDHDTTTKC